MSTYTTVSGDMWDLISHKVYGYVRFADVLIAANPQAKNTAPQARILTLSKV